MNEKQKRSFSIQRCRDKHGFATEHELARLRAKVAQLETNHNTSHPFRGSVEAAEAVKTRAAKRKGVRCDLDAAPNDAHELDEWIGTKMLELRDANDVGDLESVIRL